MNTLPTLEKVVRVGRLSDLKVKYQQRGVLGPFTTFSGPFTTFSACFSDLQRVSGPFTT